MNRPTLTLVITLLLAGTVAFPSAAAPLAGGQIDDVGGNVSLAPNSDYAYLDSDDELVVDISASNPAIEAVGVNPDSVTSFDDVFRVGYDGNRTARVWVSHDSEAVTFAVDGRRIGSADDAVTLRPNESVGVSMTVDTTGEAVEGLVDGIRVRSRVGDPPDADETGTESDESTLRATQSVAPSADARRFTALSTEPGEAVEFDAGRLELDRVDEQNLTFDSLSVSSSTRSFSLTTEVTNGGRARSIVVDAGSEPLGAIGVRRHSGTVTGATLRFSVSSSYFAARDVDPANLSVYRYSDGELSALSVRMTGERDGRVTFAAETPGFSTFVVAVDRPQFTVGDAGVDAEAVTPGELVTVTATVSNTGTLAGDRTVSVAVDGAVVAERTVTVPAGENRTISIPVVRNETGTYAVTVDGADAGSFEVVTGATATPTPSDDESAPSTQSTEGGTAGPIEEPSGFGLRSLLGLLGLLIIVGATLALARRTPRP